MTVFCQQAGEHFARAGMPLTSFPAVGNAKTEAARRAPPSDATLRIRKTLGLPDERKVVLYASQGSPSAHRLLPPLLAAIKALPNVALVIRPHPLETEWILRRMVKGVIVDRSMELLQAIQSCDVLVTESSFTAIEANCVGKPVVLWDSSPVPPLLLLQRCGGATWARDPAQLTDALQRALAQSGAAAPCLTFPDEEPALCLAKRLEDLLSTRAGSTSTLG